MSANQVQPSDILKTLDRTAESPLDFIKRNTADMNVAPTPVTVSNPQPETPNVQPPTPSNTTSPTIPAKENTDPELKFGFEAPAPEKNIEEVPEVDPELEEIDKLPEDPEKEHYQKLRAKTRESVIKVKDLSSKLDTATKDLEKYKSGAVVPEIMQQKEAEIARLSTFEKLHNLKSSPEYTEKYIKPLNENHTKLKEVFADYGIPAEHLDEVASIALNTKNRAELNNFLAENNFDTLGAEEVHKLVKDVKTLQVDARNAELEPATAYEQIKRESEARHQFQEQERIGKVSANAKDSWFETLMEVRNEGKISELIRKDNDPEFNEKFVDPILAKATESYGQFVTELVKQGVRELPKEVASALSKMTLLAHASAIAMETRDAALSRLAEIENSADRVNKIFRPNVGGGYNGNRPPPAPVEDLSPAGAAKQLLKTVLRQ